MKNKKENKKFRELFGEKASEWLDEKIPRMIEEYIKNQKKPNKSTTQKFINSIYEVKELKEKYELDTLPSQKKLRELGYSGLSRAITKYHGGMNNFRELLGEEPLRKSWRTIPFTSNYSPATPEQAKARMERVKKLVRPKPEYWQSLENTISESKKLMKEKGFDKLPPGNKLRELGYSGLRHAISDYHGGLPIFREKHFGEKEKEQNYDRLPPKKKNGGSSGSPPPPPPIEYTRRG